MKKIGIDARLYSQTGVGTYLRNFIHELTVYPPKNTTYYLYVLPSDVEKLLKLPVNFIIRKAPYLWHSFSEQCAFLKTLNDDHLDLMHFTYFGYPVLYRRKFVATVHDLTPLLFKTGKASTKNPLIYGIKHFFFKHILRSQIENAVSIITPTETVKNQIVHVYGSHLIDKIVSLHEGVGYELAQTKENESLKSRYQKPFFIYVGNFYPHKNIKRLVDAFADVKTEDQLILIGPKDYFATSILHYIKQCKMEDRIIIVDNATTPDLVFFYKHAQALIHPSLSEGFGLPIIEAAYFNLPIIASNIPVFQELLKGQYISFNPHDTSDIQNKITNFISHPLKADYGSIWEQYSFKTMTQQTLSLYHDALESKTNI